METTSQLIPAAQLRATPWKNGGGSTREIMVYPPEAGFDTFSWRISLAEVAQPGAFSTFDGIDRHIVLTHGKSMVLHNQTQQSAYTLTPFAPYPFVGEDQIEGILPDGPTFDFNLMVRREHGHGTVQCYQQAQQHRLAASHYVFHCATGTHQLRFDDQEITLQAGDSLYWFQAQDGLTLLSEPLTTSSDLVVAHIQLLTT